MELMEALNWRYAVKRFSDERISAEQLHELLSATCLSASSYGLQPYTIVLVESQTVRKRLLHYSMGQDKVLNSSHLIVFAAHTDIGDVTVDRYLDRYARIVDQPPQEIERFSAHVKSALAEMKPSEKQQWAHQQAYIALGNLLTCAALMKIDSCPMGGFDQQGYDEVLGLADKGLTTTVVCPVGRRHSDDQYAYRPKVRMSYQDLVLEV